jgi:Tfp pilus assembly protein PilF
MAAPGRIMKTLYDVLGVCPDDDADNLKNAFRNAVKASHPDLHTGDPDAPLRGRQIIRANAILSDEERRAAYDRFLAFKRSQVRSESKRNVISDTIRNIAAHATAVAVLVVMLAGGSVLFTRVSTTSAATVNVVEVAARGSIEIAAGQPPMRAGSIGRGEPRDKLASLELRNQAIAPSTVADAANGHAQAIAQREPAEIAAAKPGAQTDTTGRDDEPRDNPRTRRMMRVVDYPSDRFPKLQTEPRYHPKWGELPGSHRDRNMQDKLDTMIGASASAGSAGQADPPAAPAAAPATQTGPPTEEAATTDAVRPRVVKPELIVASTLDAEAAAATPLAIKVGGEAGGVPAGAQVRVEGLSGGATLSGGQADADHGWLIPPGALENIKIQVPSDMTGAFDLRVALVDHEGAVLAERHLAVRIRPRTAAVLGDASTRQQTVATTPAPSLRLVGQQQAIAILDRAIRRDPNDAEAYNIRGNVWDDMGDVDRALADYEQAIRIDPKNPATFRDRGILWRRKGALDKALVDFDRAIRLSFSDAQVYSDRGLLWYEKGYHDRAIADFRRAAEIDRDFAIPYINRGVLVHRRRDIDGASSELDQAIHVDPGVVDAIQRDNLHR